MIFGFHATEESRNDVFSVLWFAWFLSSCCTFLLTLTACFSADSLPRLAGSQVTVPAQLIDASAVDGATQMWSGILQLPQAGSIVRLDFQCRRLSDAGTYSVRVYDQGDTTTSSTPCNPCVAPFSCVSQGSTKVCTSGIFHVSCLSNLP